MDKSALWLPFPLPKLIATSFLDWQVIQLTEAMKKISGPENKMDGWENKMEGLENKVKGLEKRMKGLEAQAGTTNEMLQKIMAALNVRDK